LGTMKDISRKQDLKVTALHILRCSRANPSGKDVLIVNTNSDLNMYKEMWQKEDGNEAPPQSSCCGSTTVTEPREVNGLPDVDFNVWTGELQRNQVEHKIRY
jgi:arsenite methyltransferase